MNIMIFEPGNFLQDQIQVSGKLVCQVHSTFIQHIHSKGPLYFWRCSRHSKYFSKQTRQTSLPSRSLYSSSRIRGRGVRLIRFISNVVCGK